MPVQFVEAISDYIERKKDDDPDVHSKHTAKARYAAQAEFKGTINSLLKTYQKQNARVAGYNHHHTESANQHLYTALVVWDDEPEELCQRCAERAPIAGDYLCEECR